MVVSAGWVWFDYWMWVERVEDFDRVWQVFLMFETLVRVCYVQAANAIGLHGRVLIPYLIITYSYYMKTWCLVWIVIPWSGMRMNWNLGFVLPYGRVHIMLGFGGFFVISVSFYMAV